MLACCKVNQRCRSVVDDECVRILRRRIRHLVFGDVAGLGIELADQARRGWR